METSSTNHEKTRQKTDSVHVWNDNLTRLLIDTKQWQVPLFTLYFMRSRTEFLPRLKFSRQKFWSRHHRKISAEILYSVVRILACVHKQHKHGSAVFHYVQICGAGRIEPSRGFEALLFSRGTLPLWHVLNNIVVIKGRIGLFRFYVSKRANLAVFGDLPLANEH